MLLILKKFRKLLTVPKLENEPVRYGILVAATEQLVTVRSDLEPSKNDLEL